VVLHVPRGDDHVGGDGCIRVLSSADGKAWMSTALIGETGIDLSDPNLSLTPDDRLMIVAGGSVYEARRYVGRQPRVMFSSDGSTWTTPAKNQGVLLPDRRPRGSLTPWRRCSLISVRPSAACATSRGFSSSPR
jgi:hypothetical protein